MLLDLKYFLSRFGLQMSLGALSVCVITNKGVSPNNAIQSTDLSDFSSSNLYEKFSYHPCKINLKTQFSGDKIGRILNRKRGSLVLTSTVYAIRKEHDETNIGGSSACTDDLLVIKNEGISKEKGREDFDSLLHSEKKVSENIENLGNRGNLLDKLKAVHMHVLAMEQWNASRLTLSHRSYLVSATNLIHYLALKSLDVEQLREDLSSIGLLNLETINPYVLASLSAGIHMLENLRYNSISNKDYLDTIQDNETLIKKDFTTNTMRKRVASNREILLGPLQDQKTTHIMVTVGEEVTKSGTLMNDLLKNGTTVIRINCAHGNPSIWSEIIRKAKESSQMLEKPCRIMMDLAGPKLRTDKMKNGPCVTKISPTKNTSGNVIFPAQIWLSHRGSDPPPDHLSADLALHIDGHDFLNNLEIGDTIRFSDTRGKQRVLKISKKFAIFGGIGFIAESTKTAYVENGTKLHIKGNKRKSSIGFVVEIPPVERFVRVRIGDLLTISREKSHEDYESDSGTHKVSCSSGYLFDSVKPGDPIAFDDGKIWGVIKGTSISEIVVSVTLAGPNGTKLGSEKSINIPESNIRYEGLTSKDLVDLDFVARHADILGISFVRDVRDIIVLHQELAKRKVLKLGVVLKIETKGGFVKLPLILLEAMKFQNPLGVMIARGDLAVECGWEKLADVQEEILSICSAAHVPVIWATQVLESMAKTGVPTRAEITDVATGRRASCIMLNKGKHIVEAVSTLDRILRTNSSKVKAELKPFVLSSHLY